SSSSFGCLTCASPLSNAPVSASSPRLASTSTPIRSASWAPAQAVVTMARSSRRLGKKMPGVSTKISCASPSVAMPRMSARVVCPLCDTIVTLVPTSALMSVDLPTLGAPMSATKPQRVPAPVPVAGSAIGVFRLDPFPRQHGGGGGLLGGALRAAEPLCRRAVGQLDRDAELRIVVGPRSLDLPVRRRRQPPPLCPFLQDGLGIAQRPHRGAHALLPEPRDQLGGGRVAAVEVHCPDQRLADVRQDGGAVAPARVVLRRAQPDGGA